MWGGTVGSWESPAQFCTLGKLAAALWPSGSIRGLGDWPSHRECSGLGPGDPDAVSPEQWGLGDFTLHLWTSNFFSKNCRRQTRDRHILKVCDSAGRQWLFWIAFPRVGQPTALLPTPATLLSFEGVHEATQVWFTPVLNYMENHEDRFYWVKEEVTTSVNRDTEASPSFCSFWLVSSPHWASAFSSFTINKIRTKFLPVSQAGPENTMQLVTRGSSVNARAALLKAGCTSEPTQGPAQGSTLNCHSSNVPLWDSNV